MTLYPHLYRINFSIKPIISFVLESILYLNSNFLTSNIFIQVLSCCSCLLPLKNCSKNTIIQSCYKMVSKCSIRFIYIYVNPANKIKVVMHSNSEMTGNEYADVGCMPIMIITCLSFNEIFFFF